MLDAYWINLAAVLFCYWMFYKLAGFILFVIGELLDD